MVAKFTFFLLACGVAATAQVQKATDSVPIASLNMLSKIATDTLDSGLQLPLSYKWTRDVRFTESLKRMSLQSRQQDANGRDLPVDVFHQVRNEVLFKDIPFR